MPGCLRMLDRCRATTRAGAPCAARPLPGQRLCPWHAPQLAERRAEWSRKGGEGKGNARRASKELPPAMGGEELLATLTRVIRRVEAGELAPGPANAIANLARSMNATRELVELEQRLAAVEAAVGADGGR